MAIAENLSYDNEPIDTLSSGSQAFLRTYSPDFSLQQLQHLLRQPDQPRTIAQNPRIVGKLHFQLLKPLRHAPKSMQETRSLVEQGVLDCVNGELIQAYMDEWNFKYTNATAERNLKAATIDFPDATYALFPLTMRQRRQPTDAEIPEVIFLDTNHCLSPTEPTSTRLFNNVIAAERLVKPSDIVLDLCAGTGITALIAGYMVSQGNGHVYALDIMPQAIDTEKCNIALHGLEDKITAIESDMFANLPSGTHVDTIFINPPFYPKNHKNSQPADLDEAVADVEFSVIRQLFHDAPEYLKSTGKIYVLYEDLKKFPGDKNAVEYFADRYNHKPDKKVVYSLKTIAQMRRARIDQEGKPMSIAFKVYEITLR